MTLSKLARLFAPPVTIIALAARLTWSASTASRPRRRAHYVPRHARPGKMNPAAGERSRPGQSSARLPMSENDPVILPLSVDTTRRRYLVTKG
jgi:hypothetical protein